MAKRFFIKTIFALFLICITSNVYAKSFSTAVLLKFDDNTVYKELNTDEIIDKLLLDKLLEVETLYIYERTITSDSLDIEKDLVGNKDKVNKAIDEKNFTAIFQTAQSDIAFKQQGDYLPCSKTRKLKEKYGVDYIIYGSVDFIGGKERDRKIVWDNLKYGHSSNIVTVFSTLRIIESNTGKIVWCHREKGRVKDRFDSLNNFSYGTKEFSNHLFYEALDEISEKMIKKLSKDLDKGILKL